MVYLGCHLSASEGFEAMGRTALELGADTFQFFTRNPRGGQAKELKPEDAAALRRLMEEHRFGPLVAHAPYTINPCSDKPAVREFALQTMQDDMRRMELIPGNYYNFHPGSHMKQGIPAGIAMIADMLNRVLPLAEHTTVLLETMAGKGSEVGSRFDELRAIIDRVELPERLGVCLDTCHIYDGGYDLVKDPDAVLEEFDRVIGLRRLKAIHLNDSKNSFFSHKDRHEKIGLGSLGLDTFRAVINHPALQGLPMELETPNDLTGYKAEIKLLREAMNQ